METKRNLLQKLFYNPRGVRSKQKIYEQTNHLNSTITIKHVKEWYDQHVEATRYYGSSNSVVAPHANYEFQIDVFFISDVENNKYKDRHGLHRYLYSSRFDSSDQN